MANNPYQNQKPYEHYFFAYPDNHLGRMSVRHEPHFQNLHGQSPISHFSCYQSPHQQSPRLHVSRFRSPRQPLIHRHSPYPLLHQRSGPRAVPTLSLESGLSEGPKYSYSELLNDPNNEIHGNLIKVFGRNNPKMEDNVKLPRGIAYDEVMDLFIVVDSRNNHLRFYREESNVGDIVNGALRNPSAVAIVEPGRKIAVLDSKGIRLYDYQREQFELLVQMPNCRGLGCTNQGDLVTIHRAASQCLIQFYSSQQQNMLLRQFEYKWPSSFDSRPNPCFLDVCKDRLCITDLGTKSFTIYELDPPNRAIFELVQKQSHGKSEGQFKFISAVKFDKNGELLIADSCQVGNQQGRLQYFDRDGNFKKMVKFSDDFVYATGMVINRRMQLMISHYCKGDEKNSCVKLYQLKPAEENWSHVNPRLTDNEKPNYEPDFRHSHTDLAQLSTFGQLVHTDV